MRDFEKWVKVLRAETARIQAECAAMCMMPMPHRDVHLCSCHCALPSDHAGKRHKCTVQIAAVKSGEPQ